jgi:hypothetical protein
MNNPVTTVEDCLSNSASFSRVSSSDPIQSYVPVSSLYNAKKNDALHVSEISLLQIDS